MNIYLNVLSSLSSILPAILYIAIGGTITFLSNYFLERMRYRYNIKRDIYFEVLDLVSKGPELLEQFNIDVGDDREKSLRIIAEWEMALDAVILKLEVCGSEEIKKMVSEYKKIAIDYNMVSRLNQQLIQSMKQELLPTSQQFWRRG